MKNIFYLTYQSFPAETANSLQTITNIKYLVKNDVNVKLIFPLRESLSDDNIENIQNYYKVYEDFEIIGTKHSLPFGKWRVFKKSVYIFSHFYWSQKCVKDVLKNYELPDFFFTRSDWVLFFLAIRNQKVVFECHQLSKIRKIIMRYAVKKDSVKIIFLNEEMFDDSKIKEKFRFKILFQPNGFDEEIFFNFRKSKNNDDKKTIIFAGNLSRFNEDRGLDTLLKAFMSKSFRDKYNLKIIGGPDKVKDSISTFVLNNSLNNSITITGRVSRNEAIKQMINSDIGILTNSDKNQHSFRHTSPLKYFEYLYAGLKVVALDFPSHKKLPFSKNISFYKVGDVDSFKLAILKSSKSRIIPPEELLEYSLDRRVKNILKFIS